MQVLLNTFTALLIVCSVAFGQALTRPDHYYARAVTRLEQGNLEAALADLNKAIEMLPKYAAAYALRGSIKLTQGDIDAALVDFGRSIELTPDVAIPYYKRGFILLERKDFDAAIKDFDKALEIQPGLAIVYRNRADAKRLRSSRKTSSYISNAARSNRLRQTLTAPSPTLPRLLKSIPDTRMPTRSAA